MEHSRRQERLAGSIGQSLLLPVHSAEPYPMQICFVIQPFEDKFDRLYDDVFCHAVQAAGLEPYRVDKDPRTENILDAIEKNIKKAAICLIDITSDNPNVWYELGFAIAADKQVVMVCSAERNDYPFDISHRPIIKYYSRAPSDFVDLQKRVTERLVALLRSDRAMSELAKGDPVAPQEGLKQYAIAVLGAVSAETECQAPIEWIRKDVERGGFTGVAFNLGIYELVKKGLIEKVVMNDPDGGWYIVARVTAEGLE